MLQAQKPASPRNAPAERPGVPEPAPQAAPGTLGPPLAARPPRAAAAGAAGTGDGEPPAAGSEVDDVLRSGGGRPLEPSTRAFFEARLGLGLGAVRVHTGAAADRSARSVGALAYTVGSDVAFRAGYFAPQTAAGRALLAHELAHVAQGGRAGAETPAPRPGGGVRLAAAADPAEAALERQAEAVAGRVASGRSAAELLEGRAAGSGARVRRQGGPVEHQLPDPVPVTWGGDSFEIRFEHQLDGGVDYFVALVHYTGPHPTSGPFVRNSTQRLRATVGPRALSPELRTAAEQELVLDLYGDRESVVRISDSVRFDDRSFSRGREHQLTLLLNGRLGTAVSLWVLDPAASAADTRPFAPTRLTGSLPEFGGFSLMDGPPRLQLVATIDGDGDRTPELEVDVRVSSFMSWAQEMEEDETVHVRLRQANDPAGMARVASFQVHRPMPGSRVAAELVQLTDGRGPTIVELTNPPSGARLRIYPPERAADGVRYRVEGPGLNVVYGFPPEAGEVRPVFEVGSSDKVGRIAFWDVQLGPYADAFRILLDRSVSADRAVLGIAPLSRGQPYGGVGIPVAFRGSLPRVALLRDDPVSLGFDFDGDGVAEVRLHDRLQVPAATPDVSPEAARDHHVRVSGSAVGSDRIVTISVRDGILAGHSGTAPEDRAAHAAARAAGELHAQSGTTFADRRGDFELAFHGFRARAVDAGWITRRTYDAWYALSADMIRLEVQAPTGTVENALRDSAAAHATELYDSLAAETAGAWESVPTYTDNTSSEENPYTGAWRTSVTFAGTRRYEGPGAGIAADLQAGRWSTAMDKHRMLSSGVDRWVVESARRHGAAADELARMRGASAMLRELDALAARNPVRVPAVFRPDPRFAAEPGYVEQIPLELYYWRDGGTWRMVDLTNPERPFRDSVPAGSTDLDTAGRLLAELNNEDHFCEGRIYYEVPGIASGQVDIVDRVTWRDFFTWVGLGLAAIGITLVTFGTGTVAVVGTVALAASAGAGGIAAGINLVESVRHGTATTTTVILDLAQIVGAIAGIGALGAGRVLSVARTSAAAGAPLAGANWAALANLSQRYVVPLAGANLAADAVTLAALTAQAAEQLDAIERGPGSAEAKRSAMMRLLGQLAFTGGLTALSLRGNVAEITAGRSIEVVNVGGQPVVVPVGMSTAGRSVTESGARIAGAADPLAAEAAHLANIRSRVEGAPGRALADVEELALASRAGRPDAALVADAAGAVTRGGAAAGTVQELVDRVARANNAARAHGVDVEYVLEMVPGPTPGTSQLRVTSRSRTPAAPGATGHLYVDVGARTAAEAAQVQRLRAAAGNTPFRAAVLPDGMVQVNGQLEVHPARLAEIGDADLATLVRATSALDAVGGDLARLRAANPAAADQLGRFTSSTAEADAARAPTRGYRLRFQHSRATAQAHLDALLARLGTTRAAHPALASLTPAELNRLYDIFNATVPGGTTRLAAAPGDVRGITRLETQAARYALDQPDLTARSFVEHYEFYLAEFTARVNAGIAAEVAAGRPRPGDAGKRRIRGAVETAMGDPANPLVSGVAADVRRTYEQMVTQLDGRVGAVTIRAGMSDAATVRAVQQLPEVRFGSPSSAVYHVRKHFPELPPAEQARGANEVQSYISSAAETVRTADPVAAAATRSTSQDGSFRSYSFVRSVGGETLRAIVMVFSDGRVIIATYP